MSKPEEFDYVEFVDKEIYNRNFVVRKSTLSAKRREHPAYVSIFTFKESVIKYISGNIIEGKPSISYYSDELMASFLWIDIDVESDLTRATDIAIEVMNILYDTYKIHPKYLKVFFSGNKGYHIGISTKIFDADKVISKDLPAIFKSMVIHITSAEINDNGVPSREGIDFSIYNPTSVLRMPNSKHNKTSAYKTQINPEFIFDYMTEEIISAANLNESFKSEEPDFISNELVELFVYYKEEHSANDKQFDNENGLTFSKQDNSSIFHIPDKGLRNDTLFKQAFRLFAIRDLKNTEVLDIMRCVCDVVNFYASVNGQKKVSELEFRNLMRSALRRARVAVLNNTSVDTVHGMVGRMFEFVKMMSFVPIGITDMDMDLAMNTDENDMIRRGLVAGNSYSIIGKGGTKKSLIAQQIGIDNAAGLNNKESNDISIFFNLEMSELEYFKRAMYMVLGFDFISMVKNGEITQELLDKIYVDSQRILRDNLVIISRANMTIKEYMDFIKITEDKHGKKVALTVIDSMNAMGVAGNNETLEAVKISLELKNACKEMKVANILVNHVTQACTHHVRDTAQYVRGGGKVIDNCDAYFCTSKVVDIDHSVLVDDNEERDVKYLPELIYLRFHNKRGSGRTIDKILYVNPDTLRFVVAEDLKPEDFSIKRLKEIQKQNRQ